MADFVVKNKREICEDKLFLIISRFKSRLGFFICAYYNA